MKLYDVTTQRLGLRKWVDTDLEPFAKMNRDKDVMKFFPALLSENDTIGMIKRIKTHFDKNGFGLFAVDKIATGNFIGFTGFSIPTFESSFTPCVEIGWRYKKDTWGQGFATEAAMACLHYGFDVLHFEKVVSFTSVLNTNSEKVMKRIGMEHAGFFDHPKIEKAHPLCRHVLYQITRDKIKETNHK